MRRPFPESPRLTVTEKEVDTGCVFGFEDYVTRLSKMRTMDVRVCAWEDDRAREADRW